MFIYLFNADGKEPAEGEGADPVERRGTADGAEGRVWGTTRVGSDSCRYRELGGLSLAGSREGPILPSSPGSSGLWRFYVIVKKVTHHL